jgi:putative lipoic acid-binding regulatory protein
MSAEEQSLLTFPCSFPIKVMGTNTDGFAQTVVDLVRVHCPDYDPAEMTMRPSTSNNFLSLTITVFVNDKPQLDALYQSLVNHPSVRFVL